MEYKVDLFSLSGQNITIDGDGRISIDGNALGGASYLTGYRFQQNVTKMSGVAAVSGRDTTDVLSIGSHNIYKDNITGTFICIGVRNITDTPDIRHKDSVWIGGEISNYPSDTSNNKDQLVLIGARHYFDRAAITPMDKEKAVILGNTFGHDGAGYDSLYAVSLGDTYVYNGVKLRGAMIGRGGLRAPSDAAYYGLTMISNGTSYSKTTGWSGAVPLKVFMLCADDTSYVEGATGNIYCLGGFSCKATKDIVSVGSSFQGSNFDITGRTMIGHGNNFATNAINAISVDSYEQSATDNYVTKNNSIQVDAIQVAGFVVIDTNSIINCISKSGLTNRYHLPYVLFGSGQNHVTDNLFISGSRVGIANNNPQCELDIAGNSFRILNKRTPTGYNDIGNSGTIQWDESYLYLCTGTNAWARLAFETGW